MRPTKNKIKKETTPPTIKPSAYVITRSRAGVFAGTLVRRSGQEVLLRDARRLWYWCGAASLSELAIRGPSAPESCKFPAPVPEVLLLEVIEVLAVTDQARAIIEAVPIWTI